MSEKVKSFVIKYADERTGKAHYKGPFNEESTKKLTDMLTHFDIPYEKFPYEADWTELQQL